MKFKTFLSLFFTIAIVVQTGRYVLNFFTPAEVLYPFASTKTRNVASLNSFLPNRCEGFFNKKKPLFNVDQFLQEVNKFDKRSGPTDEEIHESMGNPETFLAIIEYFSRKDNYEGFKFGDALAQLEPKELQKLYMLLYKKTEPGELTEYDFKKLVVQVYRIVHRPRGILKSFWDQKSLLKAFETVDDQKILERIEMTLFNQGMNSAFETIMLDPTVRTRFLGAMKEYRAYIDMTLAAGLWTTALVFKPEIAEPTLLTTIALLVPPYLPSFSQFISKDLTEQDLAIIRDQGIEKGYASVRERLRLPQIKQRNWNYMRQTSMLVFGTIATIAIIQADHEAQAKASWQNSQSVMEERINFAKLPVKMQAEEDWKRFVAYAKTQGMVIDESSPEIQKEKASRTAMYIATHTQRK